MSTTESTANENASVRSERTHVMDRLLTVQNAKTRKGEKLGILTGILYLAPANESGVMNTCASSTKLESAAAYCRTQYITELIEERGPDEAQRILDREKPL